MQLTLLQVHCQGHTYFFHGRKDITRVSTGIKLKETPAFILKCRKQMASSSFSLLASAPMNFGPISASYSPLDLTEENINLALADAKLEVSPLFIYTHIRISISLYVVKRAYINNSSTCNCSLQLGQLFDTSVGITGDSLTLTIRYTFFWVDSRFALIQTETNRKSRIG